MHECFISHVPMQPQCLTEEGNCEDCGRGGRKGEVLGPLNRRRHDSLDGGTQLRRQVDKGPDLGRVRVQHALR